LELWTQCQMIDTWGSSIHLTECSHRDQCGWDCSC